MADYWSQITGGQYGTMSQDASPPDYWSQLTAPTQELRNPAGPVKWGNIQATDSPETAAPMARNLGAGMMPNEQDQIRYYAQRRFPNLPEAEAVKRYGIIDGNIVYGNGEGGYSREVPSVFGGPTREIPGRAMNWLASQFGPSIPAAAGAATGAVMGPTGLSVPAAAGAGAGADVLRQAVGKMLIGDKPYEIDPWNAVGQGVMNAGGQALGVGVRSAMEANPLRISPYERKTAADPMFRRQIADVEAEAKRRGIDLSSGQATGLQSLKVQERRLATGDATTDMMNDFTRRQQQEQVPTAIRQEIGGLSPLGGREANIDAFRSGANTTANKAFAERSKAAAPEYAKALDGRMPYIDDGLVSLMKRPSMAQAWGAAKRIAAEEDRKLPEFFDIAADGSIKYTGKAVPDWRSWDYIKRGLDSVIDTHTNEFGKLDNMGRIVANTKRELLTALDAVNPDYKAARGMYGTASDAIDAIINGKTGEISKLEGQSAQNMVNRAFSSSSILPEQAARVRNQFSMAGKLNEYNAGLASFLGDKLDDAMKVNANGQMGNVAGKFQSKVWGDPRQQEIMKAALGSPARADGFGKFMEVLRRAGSSLPEGSRTATDLGAPSLTDPGFVSKTLRIAGQPWKWPEAIVDGVNNMRDPSRRIKLAEAMIGGDYDKELAKLRLVNPAGPEAAAIVGRILAGAAVPGPDDFAAPAWQQQRPLGR